MFFSLNIILNFFSSKQRNQKNCIENTHISTTEVLPLTLNFAGCMICLSTYPSLSPPISPSGFLIYFKGICWGQFTSPLNTSACILLTRIQYVFMIFFEIKFRYSEICKKWTIQCFDKCVICTPMPICQGQYELNTISFCYMLTLNCPYPARGDSTINWAFWEIPFTCLTLMFPPRPWKTLPDAYLETTDARHRAGLLKVAAWEARVRISLCDLLAISPGAKYVPCLCLSFPIYKM